MGILIDAPKCTGCNNCALICHFARARAFNPKKARISVVPLDYLGFSNPVVCLLCKNPKCVAACPVAALSQSGDGTIRVDEAKCDGCQICVEECIVGAINFDRDTKLPLICDLCGGKPECVAWCPSGALTSPDKAQPKRGKKMAYTIRKAKPVIKNWGIDEASLDWYRKFT